MQSKLTLRMEDQLIEQAKFYAAQAGKSVSQLVADYFRLVTAEGCASNRHSAPLTRSLRGLLSDTAAAEKDYKKHLEDKYL